MIVYQSTKQEFLDNIISNNIENIILENFQKKLGRTTNKNEIASWKNSMMYMNNILVDPAIPADSGIAIEYQLPQTSKRIDFIITGKNDSDVEHAVLIELKQWSEATMTNMDGVVVTYTGHAEREVSHPSYQVWSYATLLQSFNETVEEDKIELVPCAYLHNYEQDNVLTNDFYRYYIDKAPLFLKSDALKLREFIKQYIKHGDKTDLMYRIDNGRIRPSKGLADRLSSLLKGNPDFTLIDEQKVVYETALTLGKKSSDTDKNVLIVQGGPGTGKSVVAINLLVALTRQGLVSHYVTKNSAPRDVFASKLTGSYRKSEISNMFMGSGVFTNSEQSQFDVLIVDEAHRLNEKSGIFKNLGENQVKEIIHASKCSIFFIDEDQRVTFSDIGESGEIKRWAEKLGATVHTMELNSQFRCNGSDGYLAWLDNVLGIKETANYDFDRDEYDFQVVDSPVKLQEMILEKNKINNKARTVAGYCWDWVSKKDRNAADIVIPEFDFKMKWNLASDGNLWILKQEAVSEVGCIHTCQGLEVDYVGVIIGPDFTIRNGQVVIDPSKRAKTDKSLSGYKKLLKENPELAKQKADAIIKNTYRTLMTRGMKGCYVYFVDNETQEYFSKI
jgi:DUF2075 family protein